MKSGLLMLAVLFAAPAVAQGAPAPQNIPANLPLSPAVRAGETLYISGQIGQVPQGMDRHKEGFDAAVRQAMDAIGAILVTNGLDFGDLVKCMVLLDDMDNWPRFNVAYASYFEGKRFPARSAFGVDRLGLDAPIEVECIAAFK